MRVFEMRRIASPARQPEPEDPPAELPEPPPPPPQRFLETEPAVMPYVPTVFDIPL